MGLFKGLEESNKCLVYEAKTSLISQTSTSSLLTPVFSRSIFTAGIRPIPIISGDTPAKLKRCGVETKLIVQNSNANKSLKPHSDSLRAIQNALKNAITWNLGLLTGKYLSMKEIAINEEVSQRYIAGIMKLAFLSPSIMEKIANGNIPHDMTLTQLRKNFSLDWAEQELIFR